MSRDLTFRRVCWPARQEGRYNSSTGWHWAALPFANGQFAGIVAAGVFTSGHVGAEGLDELIRICRPDGVIVLTVKNTLWEEGFAPALPISRIAAS